MSSYLSEASQDHQLPPLSTDRLHRGGAHRRSARVLKCDPRDTGCGVSPQQTHYPLIYAMPVTRSIRRSVTCGKSQVGDPADVALIAVGGYGRGELFPHSDIDILVLTESTPADAVTLKLEGFITMLWDIGLQIGHSVRTLEECAALASRRSDCGHHDDGISTDCRRPRTRGAR